MPKNPKKKILKKNAAERILVSLQVLNSNVRKVESNLLAIRGFCSTKESNAITIMEALDVALEYFSLTSEQLEMIIKEYTRLLKKFANSQRAKR